MVTKTDRIAGVWIGGVEPCSLSDFPNTVAAVLFTQGCNFRCAYCHNRALISQEGGVSPQGALELIWGRRGRLQGVVVTGGEPTLQPGLASLLALLKGWDLRVKLDTNGSNPETLQGLISQGLVDFIAMDVKAPPGRYHRVTGPGIDEEPVWRSIKMVASSGVPHLFRTTWDRELLSPQEVEAIAAAIPAGSPHILQERR